MRPRCGRGSQFQIVGYNNMTALRSAHFAGIIAGTHPISTESEGRKWTLEGRILLRGFRSRPSGAHFNLSGWVSTREVPLRGFSAGRRPAVGELTPALRASPLCRKRQRGDRAFGQGCFLTNDVVWVPEKGGFSPRVNAKHSSAFWQRPEVFCAEG